VLVQFVYARQEIGHFLRLKLKKCCINAQKERKLQNYIVNFEMKLYDIDNKNFLLFIGNVSNETIISYKEETK
jgi:hypothetical protein